MKEGKKREIYKKETDKMENEIIEFGPVHDYLDASGNRGIENRRSGKALAQALGLKDTRTLQECIAAEINSLDPILSTGKGGYFLAARGPAGRCEIIKCRDTVQKRARHTMARASVLSKAVELRDAEESGQTTFDEMEERREV